MKKLLLILITLASINCFSQEIEFGKVSKAELEEKFYPLDSTADAAYLHKYRKSNISYKNNSGFIITTEVHERIKIYTKEGFEKATKSIRYYKPEKGGKEKITSIKGYSFSLENGKIKKEKLSKSSIFDKKTSKYRSIKEVTFPNIKVGSIIELTYKLISPYSTIIDDVEYQFDIPVKYLYCKIETPEYYNFSKKSKGYFSIQPKSTVKNESITMSSKTRTANRGDGRQFGSTMSSEIQTSRIDVKYNIDVFETQNIPSLKDNEPFTTNINNYKGGIKYELASTQFPNSILKYYSNTWDDVSKQVHNSSNFTGELEKTNYFEEDVQNAIAGATNDFEKLGAIFHLVKEKVKWNEYYGKYVEKGVKKAYKDGSGNVAEINLMLTSMLRFAGLNSNPVLVSTRNNGIPLSPTLKGFNYVISMVNFPDNQYVLLDATEIFSSPNLLPVRALNWNGRIITKKGQSSWVKLTSKKLALEENFLNVKMTDNGSVSGLLRTNNDNLNALKFRNSYNHIKDESLISKLEESYSIEIENYRLSNKNNIGKPINQMSKFSSDDLVEEISGKLYINSLLFLTQSENPFKSEERKFPVDFASPWKDSNNVSIQIPEGYKIETTPDNLAIGLPDDLGFFKFQITPSGNKIKIQSVLQFNSAIIKPEYYTILKDFYGKVIDKQLEKIVLSK
ncbi:transglutaminase domain-containing protein [Tenacibaculum aquimarinum]|uniref:transglutaminase domain-containing protein n=1 Tax=Tenacibaculum aquimarinum TaxID=2910675 RepID=UPI001F0B146E|nr:DUF3857 domain-containing protein [Tenacibaculum aquimarinum]MCH3884246.1 DUF3857 domain-containing protein [Tenacibaculum aquimarinum]